MEHTYLEFEQPVGLFFLTTIPASVLIGQYVVDRRVYEGEQASGIQRALKEDRIKEIADYVVTQDASFPTSIVLALREGEYTMDKAKRTVNITGKVEVVDGQHRLEGLRKASDGNKTILDSFALPCVLIVEPTPEQKAFIFATINGKQTKVNASLVYDLFGISKEEDPYHILNKVARTLNFSSASPFYDRLKMLGSKSDDKVTESLTQGAFVKVIMELFISRDPMKDRDLVKQGRWDEIAEDSKLILREYFRQRKGDKLINLFSNIFTGVKNTWPDEWVKHRTYILSKSTGFTGICKGLSDVLVYGKQESVLTEKYFAYFFNQVKEYMKESMPNVQFTAEHFPPGGRGENAIRDILHQTYETRFYPIPKSILDGLR